MAERTWVLVTGATSGIGLATALTLAGSGYDVIATGRSAEKLAPLHEAAEKAHVVVRTVELEQSDEASVRRMRSEVLALTDGYGVDALINNAGYAEAGAIEEIPLERLRRQFETNVIGLVAVTQAMLPEMRQRRRGRIINISSVLGTVAIPLLGAYCASKHAVEALSDALRMELADAGIQVSVIAPGSVATQFGQTVAGTVSEWVSPNSPYRDAYDKFVRERMTSGGAHPAVIARTILKALRASRPKARYTVPADSRALTAVDTLLPTRVLDKIMQRAVLGRR